MKKILLANAALRLVRISCNEESAETKYSASQVLTPGECQLKRLSVETPPGSGAVDIISATVDTCKSDDISELNR